jgi:serine phosphatase RsbU (regulator of sigma subunit)
MLKRIVLDYLSSGIDHGKDDLLRLKFTIVNAFTVIGVVFVFSLGVFNITRQYFPLGVVEIAGGFLCIINVILLRRTRNIEFASFIILFLMLCLFVSLIVFGGEDKTGLFWFFTFPPLALFLKKKREGLLWIGAELVVITVMTAVSECRFLFRSPYSVYEIFFLVLSLAALTLIVVFYVFIKDNFIALEKHTHEEQVRQQVLDDQFSIAERIQRLLIPQEDRVCGRLSLSGFYKAAAGVGGDYYDFFEIDSGRVAVIMCDVSGKSIAGAFVMVNIRSVFQHSIPREEMNPASMVKIINRRLLADATSDIFAVLSVYVFHSNSRQVDFCNAGYGPFAYYSAREGRVIEAPSASLPVGVVADDSNYVNTTVRLYPGDIILSYTDGILESFEKVNEKNDREALYRLVCGHAEQEPRQIKRTIVAAIGDISGKRSRQDDLSLLVAKVM